MTLGRHGDFHWLSSDCHHLRDVIEVAPGLFLNRYAVVTSNDSGVPCLSPRLSDLGWRFDSGSLCSPRLSTPELLTSIPCQIEGPDGPAFDEWYLFDSPPPKFQPLEVFVNYYFTLGRERSHLKECDFWEQLARIQPFCYLADGADQTTVVCKSEKVLRTLNQKLAEAA